MAGTSRSHAGPGRPAHGGVRPTGHGVGERSRGLPGAPPSIPAAIPPSVDRPRGGAPTDDRVQPGALADMLDALGRALSDALGRGDHLGAQQVIAARVATWRALADLAGDVHPAYARACEAVAHWEGHAAGFTGHSPLGHEPAVAAPGPPPLAGRDGETAPPLDPAGESRGSQADLSPEAGALAQALMAALWRPEGGRNR